MLGKTASLSLNGATPEAASPPTEEGSGSESPIRASMSVPTLEKKKRRARGINRHPQGTGEAEGPPGSTTGGVSSPKEGLANRVNVALSSVVYHWLEQYAARRGKSMADIIRDAIELERWAADVVEDGGTLLAERREEDGSRVRDRVVRNNW